MSLHVRTATLEDTADIVAVHKTDVKQWNRPYEQLSVVERWYHGGPWMSIETCAIHINYLLRHNQAVLVAETQGRVVGECEVYIGPTLDGATSANISVLYVHSDYQGRGIGTALLQAAEELALSQKCSCLTLYNPASVKFYRRVGLEVVGRQQHLLVSCQGYKHSYQFREITTLPEFSELCGMQLLVGQYHSPWQMYLSHCFIDHVGYALPLPRYQRQWCVWMTNRNRRALAVIYPVTSDYLQAKLMLFANTLTVDLVSGVISYAAGQGIAELQLLIDEAEVRKIKPGFQAVVKPGQLIMGKKLKR